MIGPEGPTPPPLATPKCLGFEKNGDGEAAGRSHGIGRRVEFGSCMSNFKGSFGLQPSCFFFRTTSGSLWMQRTLYPARNVDATDGALMSILIGVGVTLVFFLGLSGSPGALILLKRHRDLAHLTGTVPCSWAVDDHNNRTGVKTTGSAEIPDMKTI